MKFLILVTIASVCVLNSEAFFFKHGKGGASGSNSDASSSSNGGAQGYSYEAPPPPPPPAPAPAPAPVYESSSGADASSSSSGGHGGFDISSLLKIPIQLKMKLIEAKKQKFQKIFSKLGSLGSGFGGGSSSSSSASSGASSGGNVQSYHSQPSAQQNYQSQPVVLHLYQIEPAQNVNANSHSQSAGPAPSVPSSNYGPPEYQPAAPISSSQVSSSGQSVQSSYLPPHGNCQDNSHYH